MTSEPSSNCSGAFVDKFASSSDAFAETLTGSLSSDDVMVLVTLRSDETEERKTAVTLCYCELIAQDDVEQPSASFAADSPGAWNSTSNRVIDKSMPGPDLGRKWRLQSISNARPIYSTDSSIAWLVEILNGANESAPSSWNFSPDGSWHVTSAGNFREALKFSRYNCTHKARPRRHRHVDQLCG